MRNVEAQKFRKLEGPNDASVPAADASGSFERPRFLAGVLKLVPKVRRGRRRFSPRRCLAKQTYIVIIIGGTRRVGPDRRVDRQTDRRSVLYCFVVGVPS